MNADTRFLKALYPDLGGTFIEMRAIREGKARPSFHNNLAALARTAAALATSHDIFVGVSTRRDRNNGTKANLAWACGIWCELDVGEGKPYATIEDAYEAVRRFPLPPSMIIESGRGLHVYWILKEPWPLDNADDLATFEAVTHGLALALKGDAAWDASRVLRLPGTLWHKEEPAREVKLAELNGRRYCLSDFEAWATPPLCGEPIDFGEDADAQEAMRKAEANGLPAKTWRLISEGHADGADRSKGDFAACCDLLRAGLTPDDIRSVFQACPIGEKYREPSEGDRYLGLTIGKARMGATSPAGKAPEHLTDLGNARRFACQHGEGVRYCAPWGKWLVWSGIRWEEDRTGIVLRLARETVANIYIEAAHASDHKPLASHAMKSESEARLKAMVSLAESEPGIPILPDQFDADPWLLNVLNGTIDLRTGELLPHRRADYITKLAPVEYADDAPCPLWLGFLDRIFEGRQPIINYVQTAVGYSTTASTREQCWFLGHGRGQNGKTTFRETVKAALGDYAAVTESRTFLLERYEGVRNDLARLPGVRYLTCMETETGKKLAEGLVKLVTGGDTISARFLFHEPFEFKPVFKLWLSANHRPRITGTDYATWRRIRLLEFGVTIPEDERDPDLQEKLQQELPGILAWAVQGALDWQRHGLPTPEEVARATADYQAEQDTLGTFIAECCQEEPDAYVTAAAIYHAFSEWCKEQGEKPLRKTEFGTRLSEKGYAADRKHSIGRCWVGLRLNSFGGRDA